jgi:hypothetical protein
MPNPSSDHGFELLTPAQRQIVRYIRAVWEVQGRPPTERCIAERLGVHLSTVQGHLQGAYRRGYLKSPSPWGLRCLHDEDAAP